MKDKIKVSVIGPLSISDSEFNKILQEHGFVLDEISKDTKYVITNEVTETKEITKAKKLGVEIISEVRFRNTFTIGRE